MDILFREEISSFVLAGFSGNVGILHGVYILQSANPSQIAYHSEIYFKIITVRLHRMVRIHNKDHESASCYTMVVCKIRSCSIMDLLDLMNLLPFPFKSFPPKCNLVVTGTHCQYAATQTPAHSPYRIWEWFGLQQLFLPRLIRCASSPDDDGFVLNISDFLSTSIYLGSRRQISLLHSN